MHPKRDRESEVERKIEGEKLKEMSLGKKEEREKERDHLREKGEMKKEGRATETDSVMDEETGKKMGNKNVSGPGAHRVRRETQV